MSVSYVGAGTADMDFLAALTPTIHASTTTGDYMLLALFIANDTAGAAPTVTGWTNIFFDDDTTGDDWALAVYSRVYTGSGDAPSVPSNSAGEIAQIASFRGVDTGDPIDVDSAAATAVQNATNIAVDPVTATAANGVVVVLGGRTDDWTSVAVLSGDSLTWAEIGDIPYTTSTMGLVWDYALFTSMPTLTTKTFTVTGGSAAETAGMMVVLNADVPPAITGDIAATLQKATSALAASESFDGTIAASLQKATALLAGTETFSGAVAASLQKATATVAAAEIFSGTVAGTLQKATASVVGLHFVGDAIVGNAAATLQAPTATLTGYLHPIGVIAATLQPPTATLTGYCSIFGTVESTMRAATARLTGYAGARPVHSVPVGAASMAAVARPKGALRAQRD